MIKGILKKDLILIFVYIQVLLFIINLNNFGSFEISLEPFLYFLAYSVIAFLIIAILSLKIKNKTFLIFILIIINFFSVIKILFKEIASPINDYKFKYVLYFILTVGFIYLIKQISKKLTLDKLCQVVLISILINSIILIYNKFNYNEITNGNKDLIELKNKKYNLIFLIFDSYTSNYVLEKKFNYKNQLKLDTSKYRVFNNSKSEYLHTLFTISQILNLEKHIKNESSYIRLKKIKSPYLFNLFRKNNYQTYNYSFFHIDSSKTDLSLKSIIGMDLKEISKNKYSLINTSAFVQMYTTIHFFILRNYLEIKLFDNYKYKVVNEHKKTIQTTYANLLKVIDNNPKKNYLLYGHFMLPHDPFCYDTIGQLKKDQNVYFNDKYSEYLDNVKYSNVLIQKIIQKFEEKKLDSNTILIIQGDHGARVNDIKLEEKDKYGILNIIYLPDRKYKEFSDTISNIATMQKIMKEYYFK